MLRILQQTEGILFAYSSSFLVLEEMLKFDKFENANDLIRFINTLECEIEEEEEEEVEEEEVEEMKGKEKEIKKIEKKKDSILSGFLNDNLILQSMVLKKSKETLLIGDFNLLRNISLNFDLNIEKWISNEK